MSDAAAAMDARDVVGAAAQGPAARWAPVGAYRDGTLSETDDLLAVEEPLEIRVRGASGDVQRLTVQMRTPGHDHELAVGLLYGEGLLQPDALRHVAHCDSTQDTILISLRGAVPPLPNRHTVASSACGVCGKASIDEVLAALPESRADTQPAVTMALDRLLQLPQLLRRAQPGFASTGGLHAAGLFDAQGELVLLREDVGRHNAMDKVIGRRVLEGAMQLRHHVALFSGRLGFELVQKATVAGISFLASVGAPSTLAVELATRMDMTVVGFLRDGRANVYCGGQRITSTSG